MTDVKISYPMDLTKQMLVYSGKKGRVTVSSSSTTNR
jgi:hypothetical protein